MLTNGQALRTGLFALATLDTRACGRISCLQQVIVIDVLAGETARCALEAVVKRKILRNGDVFGASVCAILTCRAGNGRLRVDDSADAVDDLILFRRKQLEAVAERGAVIVHLVKAVHA